LDHLGKVPKQTVYLEGVTIKQTVEEVTQNAGRRIAEVRRERGLTQLGLAPSVQTTVRWISRVENGEENLTLATLVKLANALQVFVDDLLATPKTTPRKVGRGRPRRG
jgi:transcriptional regulator with XRE-family HTH domain